MAGRLALKGFGALCALALVACSDQQLSNSVGVGVVESCPMGEEPVLVPSGLLPALEPTEASDARERRFYSELLRRFDEPSLWCGAAPAEAYRLIWVRTFHNPVSIRVTHDGDEARLDVVTLDGAGGFEVGPINQRISRSLSREEWSRIRRAVDDLGFWQMTTSLRQTLGNDGSMWTIEARRDGRYHLVQRWVGRDGMKEAGLVFIEVAGLQNSTGQIY